MATTRRITLTLDESAYQYLRDYIRRDQVAVGIFLTGLGLAPTADNDNLPETVGTLPLQKQPQPQPQMTLAEALTIGQDAANCLLSGAPAFDTFNLDQVNEARRIIHQAAYGPLDGTKQGKVLATIFTAMAPIQNALRSGRTPWKARGGQKAALQAALAALPQLIEEAGRGKDASYWRGFRDEALAELNDIFGVEGSDE